MIRSSRLGSICLAVLFLSLPAVPLQAGDCQEFDSTFALIQKAIFENRGCTDSVCHGATAEGGLDLRAGQAYANLVDVDAQSVAGWKRVVPGQKEQSLLWHNLAAATFPALWDAPLRAMPIGGLPPLTFDELEAVRKWLETGAPRDGVVAGTGELLDACLPPPRPIAITPLEPPAPGTGVQLRMARWELPPHSEDEVCFASYYDVSAQVPAAFRGPNGNTFRYNKIQIRQDPLSHHLIVARSGGSPSDRFWGPFACRGGTRNGESCDPTDLDFCGAGVCATSPVSSFACVGFGPGGFEVVSGGITGTQETAMERASAPGVYAQLPLTGMLIWNTHAFNLTDFDGKMEGWVNFSFAAPEEQIFPEQDIFNIDAIFNMSVPAFSAREICNIQVLPPNTKLTSVSSHTHQRGKRFRTFLGAFRCDGGANHGSTCSPLGAEPAANACAGAPCRAKLPPPIGDCDGDLSVAVNELVLGVGMSLGEIERNQCRRFDPDGDRSVTVADLVRAVNAATNPRYRDAQESLLYVSFVYNDPVDLRFDPPMTFPGNQSVGDERALTYCSLYDNGLTNPAEAKRRSTTPPNGGSCSPTHCMTGRVGAPCSGFSETERNASCNSSPGAGDGLCDACTLFGGATTEDEMFILLGTYYGN